MTEKQREAIRNFDNKQLIDMLFSYYRATVLQFEIVGEKVDIFNALEAEVYKRMGGKGD